MTLSTPIPVSERSRIRILLHPPPPPPLLVLPVDNLILPPTVCLRDQRTERTRSTEQTRGMIGKSKTLQLSILTTSIAAGPPQRLEDQEEGKGGVTNTTKAVLLPQRTQLSHTMRKRFLQVHILRGGSSHSRLDKPSSSELSQRKASKTKGAAIGEAGETPEGEQDTKSDKSSAPRGAEASTTSVAPPKETGNTDASYVAGDIQHDMHAYTSLTEEQRFTATVFEGTAEELWTVGSCGLKVPTNLNLPKYPKYDESLTPVAMPDVVMDGFGTGYDNSLCGRTIVIRVDGEDDLTKGEYRAVIASRKSLFTGR